MQKVFRVRHDWYDIISVASRPQLEPSAYVIVLQIMEISHTKRQLQALQRLRQLQQDNINVLQREDSIIRDNIAQLRRRISRIIQKRAKITSYINKKKVPAIYVVSTFI